jgi:hypothetical protein
MILFLLAAMLLVGCGQANQKQPEDRWKNTQCTAFDVRIMGTRAVRRSEGF